MLDLCLADSRNLYFWYLLESIYKFITELNILQCLFVRKSNKKQRRGRIISNFTKRIDFVIFYDNQVLLEVISECSAPSWTLQKRPSSPLQFGQEENILGHSLKAELTDLFWDRVSSVLTRRNRMMITYIIVNINPTCKR